MAKKPKYLTISDEQADKLRGKRKVTAPKSYDPGKGRPKEHLAYLNKGEMKALRGINGNNMERGPKGLPSFPPADAAGSSSKASSASKNTGPGGGMMGGSGSGGSSRTAPSSSKPSGGGTAGGNKGSGTSTSWGGSNKSVGAGSSSNKGSGTSTGWGGGGGGGDKGSSGSGSGANKGSGTSTGWGGGGGGGGSKPSVGGGGGGGPKSPMSGQGSSFKSPEAARHATGRAINKSFMENTRAQNEARMATQRAKSFGPRIGADLTRETVSPSQIAAQNTLDRIAQGSPYGKNYNKTMDQVPKDPTYRSIPSQEVKLAQEPTAGPNRGLGTSPARPAAYAASSMFEGANSPFADAGVEKYNRDAYQQRSVSPMLDKNGNYYARTSSPTVAADQRAVDAYRAGLDPTGIAMPSGRAFPVTQKPTVATSPVPSSPFSDAGIRKAVNQYANPTVQTVQKDVPYANTINDIGVMRAVNPYTAPQVASTPPVKQRQDRVVTINGVSYNVTPDQINQLSPSDQAAVRAQLAANQTPTYTPVNTSVPNYGFTNPYAGGVASAPTPQTEVKTRGITAADLTGTPATVSVPQYGFTNPYSGNQNVSPANTTETAAEQTVREAPVQDMGQYSPTVQKVMEPIADWAADKLGTRVAPSQQDSWLNRADQALSDKFGTPGPDSAYARAMSNAANRASERPAYTMPSQSYAPNASLGATDVAAAAPPPALQPLPPYVNYQQLPPDYSAGYGGGVAPSPLISQYLANGYADGGAVNDGGGFGFGERLNYALQNAPRSGSGFFDLARPVLWAAGMPTGFGRAGVDLNSYFYDQAISRGQNPYETLPWLNGSGQSKKAAPAPKADEPYKPVQQLSQYVLPPPDKDISAFNNTADVFDQQNQMFRLPEKRGGGVGDGIDAAIRLAKSFA